VDISGFHLEVDENRGVLGYYAASSGNSLLTIPHSVWVPFYWPFKMGPISFLEMSIRNYHYTLLNKPAERCSRQYDSFRLVFLNSIHVPDCTVS
jgi:hypothetical protein